MQVGDTARKYTALSNQRRCGNARTESVPMTTGIAPVTCPEGPETDVVRLLQLRHHTAARRHGARRHGARRHGARRRGKISARHHQESAGREEKHMSKVVEM